ncbi:MAG: tetratricopeptide repeat protein [Opitutaceae bacterium]|nr:tetratricopeptide repeat protein [Opitutaceae bacterium]
MPPTETGPPARRRGDWPALLLFVLVAAAYANTFGVPFLFDDAVAVERNPSIRQLWPLSVPLSPPPEGGTTTGRPVVNFSLALNYALSGEAVWSYHAFNLLIHAAAALALLGIMRRTLRSPALRLALGTDAGPLALAVAALWALHPLQTESVTGIAQRTESLCGLFYLLTLYFFILGTESPARRRWPVLAVAACLLGMGTKEVMVTAPLLVLLYDRTFVAGSFASAWRQRRGLHLALAATWVPLAWLVLDGGGTRGASAGLGLGVTWWSYLLKQCEALILYLRLSIWPHPLVLDYGTGVIKSAGEVWVQGLAVLGLLAATAWALVRRPVPGFCGAWFFIILAPSSSVIPLVAQTMAEHRMYLPLAAVVALLAVGGQRLLGARTLPVLGVVAAGLFVLTIVRNHTYRSAFVIWSDTVTKCPESARARLNLGVELQRLGQRKEALRQFERAAALQTGYVSAHYHWGATLLEEGRVEEALVQLEIAVRLGPAHADAQLALGNALVRARRPAEAVPHFERTLELRPAADAHYNLAVALLELGRTAEAEQQLGAAVRLEPGLVVAQRRLALLLAQSGRLEEAAEHLQAILAAQPAEADAHANLGNVRLLQGRAAEAVTHYEAALRLRPDDSRLRENLELARQSLRR